MRGRERRWRAERAAPVQAASRCWRRTVTTSGGGAVGAGAGTKPVPSVSSPLAGPVWVEGRQEGLGRGLAASQRGGSARRGRRRSGRRKQHGTRRGVSRERCGAVAGNPASQSVLERRGPGVRSRVWQEAWWREPARGRVHAPGARGLQLTRQSRRSRGAGAEAVPGTGKLPLWAR